MNKTRIIPRGCWMLLLILAGSLMVSAQDQGFDVHFEGVVDSAQDASSIDFDLSLYGVSGISGAGAFWASAGVRAAFTVQGFGVHADASYGTRGLAVQAGAETEIAGFGVAGDVTWRPNAASVIDLRAWGSVDAFRITGNVRLGTGAPSFTLTGSTDFEGFGLSASLAMASGTLSQASIGANMDVSGLSLSGSAGMVGGNVNVGGGAALQLGPFSLVANAGYDAGIGINGILSGALGWEAFELHLTGLYDNTGIGLEVSGQMGLGTMTLSFTGRFAGMNLNAEVGGALSFGTLNLTFSVAFGTQTGFSWAEVGFELPL